MKTIALIVLSFVLLVSIAGCETFAPQASATAIPTNTSVPTSTPVPTNTLVPIYTPVPTALNYLPVITVARTGTSVVGIDSPVSVAGVTLKFNGATYFLTRTDFGNETLDPPAGKFALVVQAHYAGDLDALFGGNGIYQSNPDQLFVSDASSKQYPWWAMNPDMPDNDFEILFYVTYNTGPYVLHNGVGTAWTVDLSSLLTAKMPPASGIYSTIFGTEPGVSLDLENSYIESFSITIPFGSGDNCTVGPLNSAKINPDGTFTISQSVIQNSTQPNIIISGTIGGNVVSGTYSVDVCGTGNRWEQVSPPYTGTWSAGYSYGENSQ